jgi:hypothetical protein
LGFAAGYDRVNLETSTGVSSNADRANGSRFCSLRVSRLGFYDSTRPMSFGGFSAAATSHENIDYISGQLRAAYLINEGNW